ncbi:uncharacterized protein LOC117497078 isoform X2 [Trematomus bernacchii]|uniref:uncharacterized protein LOC117497078 isoform X2 n=1 Tax=Trematomus bernacchii TaxID=40690 RepID=UPI00146F8C1B|nr:uncharacterized protein LOC117497078 isoform X2 [Trematomus bernacchii]
MSVSRKMRGFMHDVQNILETFKKEKQLSTVNDPLLMPQRSEWSCSCRKANSCSSLSRMLMRPSILLSLVLLSQVLRTECWPANTDEVTMANIVIPGGWGGTEDATEETQKICDAVKDQVEQRTNQKYAVYKAVTFQQQVVAGGNFNIKVLVGGENYIHLSVFQQLPCNGGNVELLSVEEGKTKDDPLVCMC